MINDLFSIANHALGQQGYGKHGHLDQFRKADAAGKKNAHGQIIQMTSISRK